MQLLETSLAELYIVTTDQHVDSRGSFSRLFCSRELAIAMNNQHIEQINRSFSLNKGTLRGLHFQHPPAMESKLVRCTQGKVFDVVVDLRCNSETYLQWHAEELSADNARMMLIPEGFAHGFQTLEDNTELLYLHTDFYSPEYEDGLQFDDPKLKINWPLVVGEISDRDRDHAYIDEKFKGITL